MKTYFNGFETNEITFKSPSKLVANRVVAYASDGYLAYAEQGGDFTGIVTSYRDGFATVVMKGHAVASYNESLPSMGICKLAPGKNGFMEADEENGKAYTVLNVDSKTKTIEFII
ncbi:MAG: hypothetical protein IJN68_06890 [Clostridia bacterium]|nr:hypothetical protein [Oscillospiraceae bacterium]MBQ7006138.1 hypothetical protein [Clostridia bacterium]